MKTVIFDLDGTLADITHRLHHITGKKKDYDAFHKDCVHDSPKNDVATLLQVFDDHGLGVLIVSGRSDSVEVETYAWLRLHGILPDRLIMRPHGDYTPDHELKRRWLHDGTLPPKEGILCVFDDRQRVVDMWREEGLTCLQVAAWKED